MNPTVPLLRRLGDRTTGRVYASCFVLIGAPFVRGAVGSLGDAGISALLITAAAVLILCMGVVGLAYPARLDFAEESDTVVAGAVVATVLFYALVVV